MRLIIVRHGQTEWNVAGRAQGQTDIPLDATGREQAARLAREVGPVDHVVTSDLTRARQTGEAFGLPVQTRAELRERSFGSWEGRDYATVMKDLDLLAEKEGTDRLRIRPPGGESFYDVWERLTPIVDELKRSEGCTLVVAHGGAKSALLARLLEGNLETIRGFRFPNCGRTEFERRPEGTLVMVRYAVPLGDPGP